MSQSASFRATVRGRVQGVFFRAFIEAKAQSLGLTGWVRNMPAGDVEVTAEGEKSRLEQLADLLKTGPPSARVDNVTVDWSPYTGAYSGFSIRL